MIDITQQKWTWDKEEGVLRDSSGDRVFIDYINGPAVATCPEALRTLHEEWLSWQGGGHIPPNRHTVDDILRRAGVLK